MENNSYLKIVEQFHILFLDCLGRKLTKELYCLKGGCNLRFFHKGIRYSEDIDIDVETIAKDTLRKKVAGILSSPPLRLVLKARGIEITETSEPKQTETTQRWKLGLKSSGVGLPVRTKIEFSRRGIGEGAVFESIDPGIIKAYSLSPAMARHYDAVRAYRQKVNALAGRAQTQARDLFDLRHLLAIGVDPASADDLPEIMREQARQRALSLEFADFKSQVWAYLKPEYQVQYDSQQIWEEMVLKVVETLEVQ